MLSLKSALMCHNECGMCEKFIFAKVTQLKKFRKVHLR